MKDPANRLSLPILLCIAGLMAAEAGCSPRPVGDPDHAAEIERWRASRRERLESETGWLTLVGLHWLEPGENRFGTDPENEIVLPEGTAPAMAGSFFLEEDRVTVRAPAGSGLTLEGDPVTDREVRDDNPGPVDELLLNDLRLYVIERGGRYAIRVKDPNSPVRTGFTGLDYFPIDPAYRVDADFVAYEQPREVEIANVLGTVETMVSPGYVEFSLHGRTHSLESYIEVPGDDRLFFIFRDETTGKETYGGGRCLYSDMPAGGKVELDFNKSYNPPCIFTPFSTCQLPPKRNTIAARIEAGEKTYGEH